MEKNHKLAQLSKIFTYTFFFILTSLVWSHPAQAAGVLQDGSMENPGVLPWTSYGQVGLLEKSNAKAFDGVRSMHVVSNLINGRGGFRQQNIPVEAGKTYTLSLQYFLTQGSLRTWVSIQNPNAAYDARVDDLIVIGSWQSFTREFTVPDNFAGAGFALMFNTQNANAYVDSVTISLIQDVPANEQNTSNIDGLFLSPVAIVPPKGVQNIAGETLPLVTINHGAATTTNSEVELTFNVTGAVWVGINTTSSFNGISFIPFTPTTTWKLSPEPGEKQLYFEFRSPDSGSLSFSEKIELALPVPEVGGSPQEDIPCPLKKQFVYGDVRTATPYFVTSLCTKRAFTNNTYPTYPNFPEESALEKTGWLDMIPLDETEFMPLGPDYAPQTGDLIKTTDNANVYLVVASERYLIASPEVFVALGYKFENVKDVDEQIIARLTDGGMIGQR